MSKRPHLLALGLCVLIPAVTVLGMQTANGINPEIAVRYPHYVRNFWLLTRLQNFIRLAPLFAIIGLWLSIFIVVLEAKERSYRWLPLAVLGPFGLIPLTVFADRSELVPTAHQRFVDRMNRFVRIAYEVGYFLL